MKFHPSRNTGTKTAPPLDLANVLRQVNAIQEQLKREQEKRK